MGSRRASNVAYHKAMAKAPSVRRRIMLAIGFYGAMSCEELEGALRSPHQTVSARLSELHKAGVVRDSGKTHVTVYNNPSIKWELADG